MAATYHLFKRWYKNKKGKRYFYWWYWYYEPGTKKQVRYPAGKACTNKQEAEDYIAQLPELNMPSDFHSVREIAGGMFHPNSCNP